MAVADYKRYLAENVLNERRTVTFRSLGRALRVHSTLAKQMLYDFHHNENSKKPQSVNATYIVTGVQKTPAPATNGHANGEENRDDVFPSSPYLSSSMPNQDSTPDTVPMASILLVREEDLEDAKSTFESISSIYIYSLQQTVLQDLNVLTDVNREMVSNHSQEDPLEYGGQWGMIQNKNVKRRTGARPAPAPTATTSKPTIPSKRPSEATSSQAKPAPKKEESAASEQASTRESTPSTTSKPTEKAAPVKREKSNLFSSFAKAKPKQKKEESATPAESAEPSGAEDVFGGDDDDDVDEEPEELFPDSGKSASAAATRESRKEREERLKKMMEDDDEDEDEEMPDATEPPEETNLIDQPPPKKPELKEEITVQGGRRRGRRQVMKKQVRKDEEGYLVTVEEPSWESFSEDEPAPPPKKKPAVSAPKGKPAGKAGQGNIMSFFSKK
ncbi:DNA polymerase subunit Cdc27 [Aspergillus pseudonomiae]|uniref:DNA polymerase delta subunit 3 n=1 Tax=Aspergillus pseudonomiae TaxID=1506151 RepID=A0A5N7D531_9EURO|nr:DNA polymerase subunit Cdc27 [Aspergillus pseudonomiae]KAE8400918.1 DNA polymerase subunit Cdc27 [Aspergillus pseudonomiae]